MIGFKFRNKNTSEYKPINLSLKEVNITNIKNKRFLNNLKFYEKKD